MLHNAVLTGLGDRRATLVISTPTSGLGADVVCANLAVSLARAGHSTALLVADESSTIPRLFDVPEGDGLDEVLRGRASLHGATHKISDVPGLSVVGCGKGFDAVKTDLEGNGVGGVLRALSGAHQYVIVRPRPNDVAADAQFFGRHADAALPVIEIGHTQRDDVTGSVRQWQLVETVVPGAVTVPRFAAPEPAAAGRLKL